MQAVWLLWYSALGIAAALAPSNCTHVVWSLWYCCAVTAILGDCYPLIAFQLYFAGAFDVRQHGLLSWHVTVHCHDDYVHGLYNSIHLAIRNLGQQLSWHVQRACKPFCNWQLKTDRCVQVALPHNNKCISSFQHKRQVGASTASFRSG